MRIRNLQQIIFKPGHALQLSDQVRCADVGRWGSPPEQLPEGSVLLFGSWRGAHV